MVTPLGRLDPVVLRVAVRGGGAAVGAGGVLARLSRLLGQALAVAAACSCCWAKIPGVCWAAATDGFWFPSRLCPSCDSPGVRLAAVAPTRSRAATSCRASS